MQVRLVSSQLFLPSYHPAPTNLKPYAGESERRLREACESARAEAEEGGKIVVMFLDEVDALCPRRDGQRQHESRLVAQLLTLLDGADVKPKEKRMQGRGQGRVEPAEEGYMIVVGESSIIDPNLYLPISQHLSAHHP